MGNSVKEELEPKSFLKGQEFNNMNLTFSATGKKKKSQRRCVKVSMVLVVVTPN